MPRKNLIRTKLFPYHVTTRTNNKEWFDIPLNQVWLFCEKSLKEAHANFPIDLISFVLMSNHYHMLVRTPDENIDKFMYEFNKRLSFRIRARSQRINSVFGGRYKWCLIQNQNYLYNCYRYIYQNPLRAGLCSKVEDYPFSSLRYLITARNFAIPLVDSFGFKDKFALSWLNQRVEDDELYAIRTGLKTTSLCDLKHRVERRSMTHLRYHRSTGTQQN